MASMIQKLIQEDIQKLEARYGRDEILSALTAMYPLVRLETYEKVKKDLEQKHKAYMIKCGVVSPEPYNIWDCIEPKVVAEILNKMEQKECQAVLDSMNSDHRAKVEAVMKLSQERN